MTDAQENTETAEHEWPDVPEWYHQTRIAAFKHSTNEVMYDIVHLWHCTANCPNHPKEKYNPAVGYFPWGMVDFKNYLRYPECDSRFVTLDDMCRFARALRSNKHVGMGKYETLDCAKECAACPCGRYKDTFEPCRRAHGCMHVIDDITDPYIPLEQWSEMQKECNHKIEEILANYKITPKFWWSPAFWSYDTQGYLHRILTFTDSPSYDAKGRWQGRITDEWFKLTLRATYFSAIPPGQLPRAKVRGL